MFQKKTLGVQLRMQLEQLQIERPKHSCTFSQIIQHAGTTGTSCWQASIASMSLLIAAGTLLQVLTHLYTQWLLFSPINSMKETMQKRKEITEKKEE